MDRRPLFGPKYQSPSAQRQAQYADVLFREGIDTSPVKSPWEALARVGTAGIGGYLSGKAGEKEKEYQAALSQALQSENPLAALQGNPELAANFAPTILQSGLEEKRYQRGREDRQKERQEERGWRLEDIGMQQDFQKNILAQNQGFQQEMARINQAFQSGQLTQQQKFIAEQNAERAALQKDVAKMNLEAQQPTRDLTNLLTSQKIQENITKQADAAKSKQEAVVSTDRMIRSIDDLTNHPGLESAVGFGYGKAATLVPGTDASSFEVRLETLKSQAFLPMVAQLKGMGQLSDAEGKKLTAAIGALDTRMSEKEFKASLNEIKADLNAARKRMGAPEEPTVPRPNQQPGNLPPLPNGFVIVPR